MKDVSRMLVGSSAAALPAVIVKAPQYLCLYRDGFIDKTLEFFDTFDVLVLVQERRVVLDLSEVESVTAAASLMLFAKVTRCQCCLPRSFSYSTSAINFILPRDKGARRVFQGSGLWAAIKPGGQSKLDRLWEDWNNPYKTGSDPSSQMVEVINQLLLQTEGELPRKIVAALQESYLNIAHHAYENFNVGGVPLDGFMTGRWWQFTKVNKKEKKLSIIIYDMGVGIPRTIHALGQGSSDCASISYAMQTGVTRFNLQGRGKGFNDIKKPIDENVGAEFLLVFSGKGLVIYHAGKKTEEKIRNHSIGGTLLEWTFSGVGK